MNSVTSYEYARFGSLVKTTQPDPDGAGSGLAPWTVFAYDKAGNLLSETDRLGNATTYGYDNLNRRTSEADANGDATTFAFDDAGNLVGLTDPEANETTWTYDALNRVIEETNELNATRYFEYDAIGNLIQKIDRNDRYTQYEYDNLYRRTEERWLDPTDDTTVIHTLNWTYDAASQLTEAADSFADYDYTYDNLGRAASIAATLAGLTPTVTLAQQFDANSRRTQLAATIGSTNDFQNDYTFDALNRLTQITQQDVAGGNSVADKRVDLAYLADGQFDEINRYASLDTSEFVAKSQYGYDGTGRLTSLSHVQGGTTFAGYGWAYDAAGRVTSFTNSQHASEDAAYSYDAASQLTAADRTGTANDEAYTFDDNGNRTNGGFVATTNNRLATDGTYNYAYDDEGNTILRTKISDGSYTEYAWDHRNRLTAVTDFDAQDVQLQKVTYAYDAFNRLVSRTLQVGQGSATSGYFVYDGTQMTLVLDANGAVQQRTLWGPAVDQILADENAAGDLYWMLTDNQNTVRDVLEYDAGTDTSTVVNHIAYDSFGRKLSETDDTLDVLSLNYTGRYLDEATGLQWNLNRWYNPATQRWMSEDPIGFTAGDSNYYRYIGNCPLNSIDPSGLEEAEESINPVFSGPIVPLPAKLTEDETRMVAMCDGDPSCQSEVARILRLIKQNDTWVHIGTNTCVRWTERFTEQKIDERVNNGPFNRLRVELRELEYTGWNPFTTIHAIIKITFPNGAIAYLDQSAYGGSDHIFFPDDLKGEPFAPGDLPFGTTDKRNEKRERACWEAFVNDPKYY